MKVYGQLEVAQLEQIASTTTTPTPTGRIYADVSNPVSAVPRFYNGTNWMGLAFTQPSSPISQNSGTAVTVNWANGLIQQVVLTGNCVISFSNPVPGQVHTLFVTQSSYNSAGANLYSYTFNMIDQDARRGSYQPKGVPGLQQSFEYQWYYSPGIKAAYVTVPQQVSVYNTALTGPPGAATCVAISPDGATVCVGSTTSGYASANGIFDSAVKPLIGNGVSFSGLPTGNVTDMEYSPDGSMFYMTHTATPFITARTTAAGYQASAQPSIPTLYPIANPGTLPPATAYGCSVHPTGAWVAASHATSPFVSVYPVNGGDGFGAKIANPGSLPAGVGYGVAFSPLGDYIAMSVGTTPFIQVWQWNQTLGVGTFGTLSANPSVLPNSASTNTGGNLGKQIAWRPQGDFIVSLTTNSPYFYVVPFNRATGAFGTPLTLNYTPSSAVYGVAWTPDGQYLVLGLASAPGIAVLDFSGLVIPATGVALDGAGVGGGVATGVAVAKHGEFAAIGLATTPFLKLISLPTKVRNYSKINS